MPTREEVDLARAAIDRGFLTIQESIKCLQTQKGYNDQGQEMPLDRIFLEAEFLSEAQLASLKESLARAQAMRNIGHYELVSKVGAGGMGTVYRAKDSKADRIVALKVLSPGHAANREYVQRFVREALASGRLSHPNIVQGYDAGEAGGQYYFAMEFVDGTTVGEMLKDSRPIPEQQALDIAIQISKALEHAEENSLIHRDIKPDNIMITQDGTGKLADLGLARVVTPGGSGEKSMFGTPYYASPEQCEGAQELDTRSDMYSFGATLFHMLAGRVPFNAETPEGIMTMHIRDRRPYLKDLNVQLSHGVSKIVRKLMARDRRERYPAMAEVTKDLTLVRMGRSPRLGKTSRHDSGEYRYRSETGSWRTRQPARGKKFLQIGACIVVGLAILFAGYGIYSFITEVPSPILPPRDEPKNNGKPEPPPVTADQVYLEGVLKRGETMEREDFLARLRSVAAKYPGTESAEIAEEKAAKIVKKMEAEARDILALLTTKVDKMRGERRYKDALGELDAFPEKYSTDEVKEEIKKLRSDILGEARGAFDKLDEKARALLAEKKYDEAAAVYEPIKAFQLKELDEKVAAAVASIRKAETDETARVAAAERERTRLEKMRREAKAARDAINAAKSLVAERNFTVAIVKLKAAAAKISLEEHKARLTRLAGDLDRAGKMIEAVKADRKGLLSKAFTAVDRNDKKLAGTIFSVSNTRLTLKVIVGGAEAIRSVPWDGLSIGSLEALVRIARGNTLSTAEQSAFAMFHYMSGKVDKAKTLLDGLNADAGQKAAAEMRRKDIAAFEQPDDNG
jgi:eukaryotic-like serine/threonine-protein kinase